MLLCPLAAPPPKGASRTQHDRVEKGGGVSRTIQKGSHNAALDGASFGPLLMTLVLQDYLQDSVWTNDA